MSDLFTAIDDLAGRGRRLRGILPGDVFPFASISPTNDWQDEVKALFAAQDPDCQLADNGSD